MTKGGVHGNICKLSGGQRKREKIIKKNRKTRKKILTNGETYDNIQWLPDERPWPGGRQALKKNLKKLKKVLDKFDKMC